MGITTFFATRQDIIEWMEKVESDCAIKYIWRCRYDTPNFPEYTCVRDLPGLGINKSGDHQDESWYVLSADTEAQPCEIKLTKGGSVWRLGNTLSSVAFYPGGMYGEDCFIHGHIDTMTGCDESAAKVMKIMRKHLYKSFIKNGTYYFGQEADKIDNVRLIQATVKEPTWYDYKKI